jgi:hypothetical protein
MYRDQSGMSGQIKYSWSCFSTDTGVQANFDQWDTTLISDWPGAGSTLTFQLPTMGQQIRVMLSMNDGFKKVSKTLTLVAVA